MNQVRAPETRRSLLRIVGTLLGLALLVYLIQQQSWSDLASALRRIPGWLIIGVALLAIASRLAVVARWVMLLRGAGSDMTLAEAARLTFAGLFASNFLPTTIGGDVVRMAGAFQLGKQRAMYAASIVVDRLVGMTAMATAVPFGIPTLIAWMDRGSAGARMPLLGPPAAMGILAWPAALWDRARRAAAGVLDALSLWLKRPRWLVAALAFSWVYMALKFSILWLLFRSLGESISIWEVAGLWSLVYFITLFPISIGGLGIQEVSASLIYSQVGTVSLSSALTVALLLRAVETLASLPGAFFVSDILASRRSPIPEVGVVADAAEQADEARD